MRGVLLFVTFFSLLPLVFFKSPFIGILVWFWISLMNPQQLSWGSFSSIPYALIIAIATIASCTLSPREPKLPPGGKTTVLLVLLMVWISVTSVFGTGPQLTIYEIWLAAEKMLLMTLVAYMLATTRERLDQLILVCVLSIAFFGIKGGLFSLLTGGSFQVLGPADSQIGDNNHLGVALTMILPLLFYLWERYRHVYPSFKWPMLALIGLTFLGDVFTY